MKDFILISGILMVLNSSAMAQGNNAFAVQMKIKNGIIEGNYDTNSGIQKYFGIPFAKPPVGDLRWKAPQPLENWKGVKETRKFGPHLVHGRCRPMYLVI
jgi:para-nitrobenzyl esterase